MWPRIAQAVHASVEGWKAYRLAIGLCLLFLAVGVLTRYSFLQAFDLRFTRAFQRASDPILDITMRGFTFLGNFVTVVVVTLAVAAGLANYGMRRAAGLVLITILGQPLDLGLKELWNRARPDASLVNVVVRTSGSSFPSGHAMGGTLLYGALAALAWTHLPTGRRRTLIAFTLGLVPLGIDLSRIYLGAHWFSDVVAGTSLALALLIGLLRWYVPKAPADVVETKQE